MRTGGGQSVDEEDEDVMKGQKRCGGDGGDFEGEAVRCPSPQKEAYRGQ